MLREIYDLGLDAAGEVWPTPELALGRLFERGADVLHGRSDLDHVAGEGPPELLETLNTSREDLYLVEALYLLTRHVTFVLTEAGGALEQTWLGLADRHLAIRAEIVERRRDEEQLKRQLAALGGTITPLPEHDDLPMADGDRPRKSREMFRDLFAGASVCESDLVVAPSAVAKADDAIAARGWDGTWGDDARLLVFTHGISLALREREADSINADAVASIEAALAESRRRLMGLEGRYATLRRRLFELRHNNRILGWRITALEVEATGMRSRLDRFLVDRDRLEQAIADRIRAGAVPRPETAAESTESWRGRLGRLFGRS
jgi:hypothetical protein